MRTRLAPAVVVALASLILGVASGCGHSEAPQKLRGKLLIEAFEPGDEFFEGHIYVARIDSSA